MGAVIAALLAAAPPLALADASGAVHHLSAYRGKVVLVNFWATWCEPCLAELPGIERLRESLGRDDFAVLAVQMGGSARTARDTAARLGLKFPLLLDRDSAATRAWHVDILPTSFLLDREGNVAFSHVGELDWTSTAERGRIQALLRR